MPGDKFPMKWDQGLLGALAPRCKVYVGPGAGYDKVDVEWITSTSVRRPPSSIRRDDEELHRMLDVLHC